jgi:hypothetical protein
LLIVGVSIVFQFVDWERFTVFPGELMKTSTDGVPDRKLSTISDIYRSILSMELPSDFRSRFWEESLSAVKSLGIALAAVLGGPALEWAAIALFAMFFAALWRSTRIARFIFLTKDLILSDGYVVPCFVFAIFIFVVFAIGWLFMLLTGVTNGWFVKVVVVIVPLIGVALYAIFLVSLFHKSAKRMRLLAQFRSSFNLKAAVMALILAALRRLRLIFQSSWDLYEQSQDWARGKGKKLWLIFTVLGGAVGVFFLVRRYLDFVLGHLAVILLAVSLIIIALFSVLFFRSIIDFILWQFGSEVMLPPREVFWTEFAKARDGKKLQWIDFSARHLNAEERIELYRTALRHVKTEWVRIHLFQRIGEAHKERRHKYVQMTNDGGDSQRNG